MTTFSNNEHKTTTTLLTTIHDGDPGLTSVKSHDDIDTTTIGKYLSSPVVTTDMINGMLLFFALHHSLHKKIAICLAFPVR